MARCLKCRKEIPDHPNSNRDPIQELCSNCLKLWHDFFAKNRMGIEAKYPHGVNGHHPTWSVFMGEIKDEKFTCKRTKEHFVFR